MNWAMGKRALWTQGEIGSVYGWTNLMRVVVEASVVVGLRVFAKFFKMGACLLKLSCSDPPQRVNPRVLLTCF